MLNFVLDNLYTGNPKWIYIINKLLHHNLVMRNLNFVSPPIQIILIVDIFPFLNFANHNQHGVNVEKYMQALREEDEAKRKDQEVE